MSMLRPLYERFEPSDLTLVALIKEEASQLLRAGVASVELLLRSNGRDGHKICSSVWQKFGYIRVHDHKRKIFLKNLIACSACLMVFNYKSRSLGTSQFRRHICHVPGGSPSSPGSVPIAPKKLSSVVPLSSTLPTTLPTASPSSSSVPPPPPEVCLRWNSYYSNMQATFPTLLNNEQFVDVTLACEGRSIKCHKVMLSACSSYFEELLSQNPCQHPIVFMRDLKFWEVQALVEFMYSGEVNVAQEKLPSLLAAAEALQIKGLTGPSQSSQQDESDYMPIQDSDEVPMSQSHKRVRKRKSTNPMAYPSRQPPQPPQSAKQMPMMHPIVQHSTSPSLSSTGGASSSGIAAQLPTSSPNRKESTSSSYHPPVKIKKERESTPPLALIKEEPLDLGKDSMETGSNNGHDLSNASSSYQASNYDRSHYSGRSLGKPQNGLSDEEDQDRLSTHSNQSDDAASLVEQKHDPGDDVSDA
ncbi:uncharacterized protein isoform X10 [Rhodnius prolixus]